MVRHLESDYELEKAPTGFIPHLYDTIDSIGGKNGLCIIAFCLFAFYQIVVYVVNTSREKRETSRKLLQQKKR
jgi:hypothetical protein